MKYSSRIYAQLLVELIEEKKEGTAERFFQLLQKNGDVKKAKDIIQLSEKILLKKLGGRKIRVEMARPDAMNMVKSIATHKDIVEEKINPELIAGAKITIDDEKQLDYSLKHKLDEIFT